MKIATTSVTVLAAFGFVAGASLAASACDFHANVTAAATPPAATVDQAAVPATAVDPFVLAKFEKAAIVPVAPKEEPAVETDAE